MMNKKEISMSVTFKCKQTGNTVTFRDAHDIDGMRKHPDYEELPQAVSKEEVTERVVLPSQEQMSSKTEQFDEVLTSQEQPSQGQSSAVKRGRPRKEK